MASALALVAAFLFALAAALQQKGALNLPEISIRHPESLARLAGQTMWLVGILALLAGYLFQAAALDRYLHAGIDELLSHWEPYALAIAGMLGFVLQQVSLGTGRLAPSVATVAVANPVVAILLGIVLLDERLSWPAWHVVVACIGLGLALVGAVVISLAREARREPERIATSATDVATV